MSCISRWEAAEGAGPAGVVERGGACSSSARRDPRSLFAACGPALWCLALGVTRHVSFEPLS